MVSGKPETVLVEAVGEEAAISGAAGALRAGGLVVLPTDTVYGLAAALDRPEAIARVFVAKGRPPDLALPVLIAEASAMERLAVDVPVAARGLTAEFWPGALTVVLPKSDLVPDEVTAGRPTVGLRLPDCELARGIIAACGGALAVTSANISGAHAPRTVTQIPDGLRAQVALIVDAGECAGGVPSTVVDLSVAPPQVLREGAIPRQRITAVLGKTVGERQ